MASVAKLWKMGCDEDLVKCLVFWANFFLALVGVTLLSLGITYKINLEELTYVIPKEYHNIILIPVLTIPLGSIIIVIAVFGCYGCLTEKTTFLTVYGIVLLVIFCIQLSAGICTFLQMGERPKFDNQLNGTLTQVFKNYYNVYEYKEVTDLIQHRLRCCGINGPTYWAVVPKSCYQTDTKNTYREPCPLHVSNYLHQCIMIMGIAVLAFSVTELIGSLMSLSFARYLKKNMRRRRRYEPPLFWW